MASRETPATRAARTAGIAFTVHSYDHDPAAVSYADEAAHALGLDPAQVFKTLVVQLADELVVCVVPADARLDLKALGKHAQMADPKRAERTTGYVVGGISPLGQRRRLRTLVDESALAHDTVHVSAGRRGLEIELTPADLVALTGAEVRALAAR
jgi:Cys-tRNA(Pro)/Cys-tRNA(Cys) deacylase